MIPIAKPVVDNEEIEAVKEVLLSGSLAQGRKVGEFEEAFATYLGTKYAVAVSSGTAALNLALLAHDIGEGVEVITTPFSFIATANAILFTAGQQPPDDGYRRRHWPLPVEKTGGFQREKKVKCAGINPGSAKHHPPVSKGGCAPAGSSWSSIPKR